MVFRTGRRRWALRCSRRAKAPGWTRTGDFTDPRSLPVGPLPKTWGHYKGLYLAGDQTVFSYTIGSTQVLESPGAVTLADRPAITRTFNVARTSDTLSLQILDLPDGALLEQQQGYVRIRRIGKTEQRFVGFRGLPPTGEVARCGPAAHPGPAGPAGGHEIRAEYQSGADRAGGAVPGGAVDARAAGRSACGSLARPSGRCRSLAGGRDPGRHGYRRRSASWSIPSPSRRPIRGSPGSG